MYLLRCFAHCHPQAYKLDHRPLVACNGPESLVLSTCCNWPESEWPPQTEVSQGRCPSWCNCMQCPRMHLHSSRSSSSPVQRPHLGWDPWTGSVHWCCTLVAWQPISCRVGWWMCGVHLACKVPVQGPPLGPLSPLQSGRVRSVPDPGVHRVHWDCPCMVPPFEIGRAHV